VPDFPPVSSWRNGLIPFNGLRPFATHVFTEESAKKDRAGWMHDGARGERSTRERVEEGRRNLPGFFCW